MVVTIISLTDNHWARHSSVNRQTHLNLVDCHSFIIFTSTLIIKTCHFIWIFSIIIISISVTVQGKLSPTLDLAFSTSSLSTIEGRLDFIFNSAKNILCWHLRLNWQTCWEWLTFVVAQPTAFFTSSLRRFEIPKAFTSHPLVIRDQQDSTVEEDGITGQWNWMRSGRY